MPTSVYFSPAVKSEQDLYEDIIIESLKMRGQDIYYIPRKEIKTDEILNENFARFESAYAVEAYITNKDGFEGDGNLLAKFGLSIRDQATFLISKKRFRQLVSIDQNTIKAVRPREGDLIYLPLAKALFEIRFVEHEKPFYQLNNLVLYELQCELFEYGSEEFETGIAEIDVFENNFGAQLVFEISNGIIGFKPNDKIKQIINPGSGLEVYGEVAKFVRKTDTTANLYVSQITASDDSAATFQETADDISNIISISQAGNVDWQLTNVYGIGEEAGLGIPGDLQSQNDDFEIKADDIIDFSESNPFGEPS